MTSNRDLNALQSIKSSLIGRIGDTSGSFWSHVSGGGGEGGIVLLVVVKFES
jgi:hypothetical protein